VIQSVAFFAIAFATALIYWLLPSTHAKKVLLTTVSTALIAAYTGLYILVLVPFLLLFFLASEHAASTKSKTLLIATILAALALMAWARMPDLQPGHRWWLGPLGASYLAFQLIHFAVERFKGNLARTSAVSFFNYATFFPSISAGPIKRMGNFLRQETGVSTFDRALFSEGVFRIAIGLFKKIVVAQSCQVFVEEFAATGATGPRLWVAVYAYAVQIYMDFSGYTDIALGLALLFGYRIEENFNWPYLATNPSEFWKRWHMSLTGWIRDYVFIPLGGSRVAQGRIAINTLITMIAIAIWHGTSGHFLVWGLYHATGLLAYRYWRMAREKLFPNRGPSLWGKALGVFVTFHFVAIGWVFFANDLSRSFEILQVLFGFAAGR
jgi:alginate O-acetyltransferase complex protein AlgI